MKSKSRMLGWATYNWCSSKLKCKDLGQLKYRVIASVVSVTQTLIPRVQMDLNNTSIIVPGVTLSSHHLTPGLWIWRPQLRQPLRAAQGSLCLRQPHLPPALRLLQVHKSSQVNTTCHHVISAGRTGRGWSRGRSLSRSCRCGMTRRGSSATIWLHCQVERLPHNDAV